MHIKNSKGPKYVPCGNTAMWEYGNVGTRERQPEWLEVDHLDERKTRYFLLHRFRNVRVFALGLSG